MKIKHNGFHGHKDINIRVPDGLHPGDKLRVSARVARRINAAVCGCDGCQCGEYIADEVQPGIWIVTIPDDVEVRGYYPQSV